MSTLRTRAVSLAAIALITSILVVACNDSDPNRTDGRLTLTSVMAAGTADGAVVDLEARLIDGGGAPVPGAEILFKTSAGRLSGATEDNPTSAAATTGQDGAAREKLQLDTRSASGVRVTARSGALVQSLVIGAEEEGGAVIVAMPPGRQLVDEPVTFDGSQSSLEAEITAYRWTIVSDNPDEGSPAEEVVEAVDAVSIERTYVGAQNLEVTLDVTDDPDAGDLIDAGEEVPYVSGTTIAYVIFVNSPPEADAGGDTEAECAGPDGTAVTLDGSGSSDPDSSEGTNDDIESFRWYANLGGPDEMLIGEGEVLEATFELGDHEVTLVVEDSQGEKDQDGKLVSIVDTTPPTGSITAPPDGICVGPDDVPVVVTDDFTDICSADLDRTYDPGLGPVYSDPGDYTVTLTVTDASGNTAEDSVSFSIDSAPPIVAIRSPAGGQFLMPSELPFAMFFTTGDPDGSDGGVLHERVLLDDCVVYDGATYGNGDGLLSDELLSFTVEELCRVSAQCGVDTWYSPVLRVEATDCGDNVGYDELQHPGAVQVFPGVCD